MSPKTRVFEHLIFGVLEGCGTLEDLTELKEMSH